MSSDKTKIPIKEGLFTFPLSADDEPQLLASECPSCGEIIFPRAEICPNCQEKDLKKIKLSKRGKIYSFTVVTQRPLTYYKGPVPYAFGWVELPDGVRVRSLFTGCDPEEIETGMDVELIIEKMHDDEEGNEVVTYKFKPIRT